MNIKLKDLRYTAYAGDSDNVVASFANNIDRDIYIDGLREAYPDVKQGHFGGDTIDPQVTDINSGMYEALKAIKKIAGTIPGKGTLQAAKIWGIIDKVTEKAEVK